MVNQSHMTVNKKFTSKNAVDLVRKAIIHEVIDKLPSTEGIHIAKVAKNHNTTINSLETLVQYIQDTVDKQVQELNNNNYVVTDTYTNLVKSTWDFLLTLKV